MHLKALLGSPLIAAGAVEFLSGAELYNDATLAEWIFDSNSYTPHADAKEVVLCLGFRIAGSDTTNSFTVTIGGVAPDEFVPFPVHSARGGTWMGRWRGAPSGVVSIQSNPGNSGSQWSALLAYAMSLSKAVEFGATATVRDDDDSTANTSGDQTLVTEGADSLLVICNWCDRDTVALGFEPDEVSGYEERYDEDTGGVGAGGAEFTVGTKPTGAAGISHTLKVNWIGSEQWENKLQEMKEV